jgi:hypothetical protein
MLATVVAVDCLSSRWDHERCVHARDSLWSDVAAQAARGQQGSPVGQLQVQPTRASAGAGVSAPPLLANTDPQRPPPAMSAGSDTFVARSGMHHSGSLEATSYGCIRDLSTFGLLHCPVSGHSPPSACIARHRAANLSSQDARRSVRDTSASAPRAHKAFRNPTARLGVECAHVGRGTARGRLRCVQGERFLLDSMLR